jgi:AcrR family transcriptional regulator
MARARPKENVRKARSELYRQLILEAAEGCFAEKGVDETKMEEVASESGLSLGTVYSVFSGKAELVQAIHETRLRDVLRRAVRVAVGRDDPLEALLLGVRTTPGAWARRRLPTAAGRTPGATGSPCSQPCSRAGASRASSTRATPA